MRTIQIFDTTLRDGEQSPGVSLNTEEKVEIAVQLERLGVNIIEAGFAAASPGDLYAVQEVAKAVKNATVCSLARSIKHDIDQAYQALKHAESPCLHIFLATSPIHRKYKLRKNKAEVLAIADEMIRYAKRFFPVVEFSAEDAGRTEHDFLSEVVDQAIRSGADIVNLPDTVGYLSPQEYAEMFRYIRQHVPRIDDVKLSAHCHDDLGLAVANSLSAIQAGVDQIEGTINGIGERAGNASIEEVAMALQTRPRVYEAQTTINSKEIYRTSRLVSKLTGMYVPGNKAIVGANAFAHESGIHQDGMLKNKETYEIISPETVGKTESTLVLGKHSGRHAFRTRLEELGYVQSDEQLNGLFKRFKELADRKKEITDEDLIALVEEKAGDVFEQYTLQAIQLTYGSNSSPTATLQITDNMTEQVYEEAACGNGSIDAIFKTIDRIVVGEMDLVDYRIQSVTKGKDALGEVYVRLQQGEIVAHGRGVSTDVLEASARAYVDAVNRLVRRTSAVNQTCDQVAN